MTIAIYLLALLATVAFLACYILFSLLRSELQQHKKTKGELVKARDEERTLWFKHLDSLVEFREMRAKMLQDLRSQKSRRTSYPVLLSSLDLGNLIKLCHPDRHGNSELSNTVTAELLKQRKQNVSRTR